MMRYFFFCLTFASFLARAHDFHAPVNMRDSKMRLKSQEFKMDSHIAESEFFRILKGMEQRPFNFLDEELTQDERLRAGTTLFHLKIAKEYFVNVLGSEYVANLPQLNIRLDMSKPFNQFLHFVEDSKLDTYNNAVTIPASNVNAKEEVAPWNIEIWFRPPKDEEIDNMVFQVSEQLDNVDFGSTVALSLADQGVRDAVLKQSLYQSLESMDYMGYATSLLTVIGAFEVGPKILKYVSKPLKTSTYLDSAMIPEVVYHEFAHVALSDHISLRRSSPLNEGLANYFAAVINGNAKIAAKAGDHSKNFSHFDGNQKFKYDSRLETENASHSNFVFSFLWGLRARLGKDIKNGNELADKTIYESRKYIRYSEKSIKDDLIPALMDAVADVFPKTEARRIRLLINDEARKRGI